jgi:hypothetical protein
MDPIKRLYLSYSLKFAGQYRNIIGKCLFLLEIADMLPQASIEFLGSQMGMFAQKV